VKTRERLLLETRLGAKSAKMKGDELPRGTLPRWQFAAVTQRGAARCRSGNLPRLRLSSQSGKTAADGKMG
jgi:hypothetical protein